jgi:hypothetical protein
MLHVRRLCVVLTLCSISAFAKEPVFHDATPAT